MNSNNPKSERLVISGPHPVQSRPKESWNPFSGCDKISAGCRFCYAEAIAIGERGSGKGFPNGFAFTPRIERMARPKRLTEPHLIFFGSMTDLFWDQVPQYLVDQVFDVIEATPQHIYQIQTKRPERMLEQSKRRKFPRNVWAGVTVESQVNAARLDILNEIDASIRYLSCEPLLSALNLDWAKVDWVVVGGETGPHLWRRDIREQRALVELQDGNWLPRSDRLDWVRGIRDGCEKTGTAFYLKQWGGPSYEKDHATIDGAVWRQHPLPV